MKQLNDSIVYLLKMGACLSKTIYTETTCTATATATVTELKYTESKSIEKEKELTEIGDESLTLFTLDKRVFDAKIVRVYDGDTCFAVFKLNNDYVKFKIRLEGYDSPEMKPALDSKNRECEKKSAQKSKEELEKHVLNKIVKLHCGKWDKYGRLLGTIYIDNNVNINQYMIDNGFGYVYGGGTKKEFK
jgi:endonuclease YncB( thermonuclease family)